MAENKYDLLLVNTLQDKAIREQPWYKERLKTKLIKSLKPTSTSKVLNTKDWTFVRDGLDDFRDGLPPPAHDGDIIERKKGLGPNLTGDGSIESLSNIKESVNRNRFSKFDVCFSKQTPLQKQRGDHISEIEYGLLQHPLALYPHLEEGIPPDLFEDVVDILDPEMNMASDDEDEQEEDIASFGGEGTLQEQRFSRMSLGEPEDNTMGRSSRVATGFNKDMFKSFRTNKQTLEHQRTENKDSTQQNPYKWLPKKDEQAKKPKKKSQDRRADSPSQDQHIKSVTQDFCDWVTGLGGESNNIEESTIYSLFASGYETKPALSVPIHVVELTNVPPELRMSAAVPAQQQSLKTIPSQLLKKTEWKQGASDYEPKIEPFQYGAWYLPASTWKKREAGAPLLDPKQIKEQDQTDMKKKSDALDNDLAPIHGSAAFMDFVDKKGCRKPEFLERVGDIQRKHHEEEERTRLEMEAKQRMLARRAAKSS